MAEAWNKAVASRHSEVLTPDLQLQSQQPRKDKQAVVDCRTITTEAVLRKTFKEMSSLGSHNSIASLFGDGTTPSHAVDATICVAHTILREQAEGIRQLKKVGGKLAILHWEFDATPQNLEVLEPESLNKLAQGSCDTSGDQSGQGTREVLVQRGSLSVDGKVQPLFTTPKLMPDESSGIGQYD